MKTILVDADKTFVVGGKVDTKLYNLLSQYKNNKIIVTNANDEQLVEYGLVDMPYAVYSLKHNPNKTDPDYFRRMSKDLNLSTEDVVYFEHNLEAVKSAESVGIKSYHFDHEERDLTKLKNFLDENIYGKDFDRWNTIKKITHVKEIEPKPESGVVAVNEAFYNERDIVWVVCGLNIGIESDGKGEEFLRPGLIIKKFNRNHFVVLMCTTSKKDHPLYLKINSENPILKDSKIMLSQIKVIDKRRIKERMITISKNDFKIVKDRFVAVINNSTSPFGEVETSVHK